LLALLQNHRTDFSRLYAGGRLPGQPLNQDYVRTARAKGLRETFPSLLFTSAQTLWIPVVTGHSTWGWPAILLGAAIITEKTCFKVNGSGASLLLTCASFANDLPMVMDGLPFLSRPSSFVLFQT